MSFARILKDVIEEDDGLLLRVTAYEHLLEKRESMRGKPAGRLGFLQRRSGKITRLMNAFAGVIERRNDVCH